MKFLLFNPTRFSALEVRGCFLYRRLALGSNSDFHHSVESCDVKNELIYKLKIYAAKASQGHM